MIFLKVGAYIFSMKFVMQISLYSEWNQTKIIASWNIDLNYTAMFIERCVPAGKDFSGYKCFLINECEKFFVCEYDKYHSTHGLKYNFF